MTRTPAWTRTACIAQHAAAIARAAKARASGNIPAALDHLLFAAGWRAEIVHPSTFR